mmetsp:Transcript_5760/g.25959  ORF Transcript_5760/g.25959 Transcript_5760/m.25959 type:complete len:209 (-) Transcript_5760:1591-2217(-)
MLATTTTLAPFIASSGTCSTRPETTWRTPSAGPRSMDSTYSFSASGWRATFVMVPTTMLRRETSIGAFAGTSFFFGFGASAFFPLPSLSPPLAALSEDEPSAPAAPSTSCFAKRISPTDTAVPGIRFSDRLSRQAGVAGVPNFLKMASQASGMNGARKCAAAYTASSVDLMITALRAAAPSPLTAHGAESVRYLFVSFMALIASSQHR